MILGIPLFSEIETADSTNQSAPLVISSRLKISNTAVSSTMRQIIDTM
jgi:hypothetical protein